MRPNFFIIGAPKCGTTALSEYLREHPRIGFSDPKEPMFFSTDFPTLRRHPDESTYLRQCFAAYQDADLLALGEGSTLYFYSTEAARRILAFDPKARFIMMLRNPVDLVQALHAQRLLGLHEDIADFEKAWSLQQARARGEQIPPHCADPRLIMYEQQGRLGEHVDRLFRDIPPSQRLVIVFDDFVAAPRAVYLRVLDFLGVPDDGRDHFQRVNDRQSIKSQGLYQFGHRPPDWLTKPVLALKRLFGIERLGILQRLLAWTVKPAAKSASLSDEMRAKLHVAFDEDIDRLSRLLQRDLSAWKARRAD